MSELVFSFGKSAVRVPLSSGIKADIRSAVRRAKDIKSDAIAIVACSYRDNLIVVEKNDQVYMKRGSHCSKPLSIEKVARALK